MRKAFVVLICVALSVCCKGQFVDIPDVEFRTYLQSTYPTCFNTNGQMDTTCSEIINIDSLVLYPANVSNYEGLRYFKRAKHLSLACYNFGPNEILIPSLPDSLISFIYFNNGVNQSNIITFPESLKTFECPTNNSIRSLNNLPAGLSYLNCSDCGSLKSIKNLPVGLKKLNCSGCLNLDTLTNLSTATALEWMNISMCYGLTDLPNLPVNLKWLNCNDILQLRHLPELPPNLIYLNTSFTKLAAFPLLPNTLDTLICNGCYEITDLPILNEGLKYLDISRSSFLSFAAFPNSIEYLSCYSMYGSYLNNYDTLDMPQLPTSLKYLNCGGNFRTLPSLPNQLDTLICNNIPVGNTITFPPNLKMIDLANCRIRNLPALPNKVTYLSIRDNPIYNINRLPDSLTYLSCINDSLTMLPSLPAKLTILDCQNNQLTQLPTLPPMLSELYCKNNLINALPAIPKSITKLRCNLNNIYCLPTLPKTDVELNIVIDFKVKCLPNKPATLVITRDDGLISSYDMLPLCSAINNENNCQSFPVMAGKVFYDNNNNGIQDSGEPIKANAKVELVNNSYTFTNNTGYFEVGADSIGAYNLTTTPPQFFNAIPATKSFNFNSYDTLVNSSFALQANTIIDSLAIQLTPINWAARPGFSFPYLISYQNTGTTSLIPTVVFNFDSSKLILDSISNNAVVNTGNKLTLVLGNYTAGNMGSFISYFRVKPTVPLGDSIIANASITSNSISALDSNKIFVRGAFDPNDKQSTPELSPNQVAAGNYINYTIRFQNTGTDTAFNVVISDTLSNLLKSNSLQVTASSHNCKTTVNGDKVFFEFLNILLPDSNVNELKSHGFVSFKIKPINTLVLGDEIPNKAAIYFDFNSPIITNTATTTIKMPPAPPIKLISFTATVQTFNNNILFWSTINELSALRFDIEQSIDSSSFSTIATEIAKGQMSNNYNKIITANNEPVIYYRLKMIDRNGQFVYSNIVAVKRNAFTTPVSILNNPANTTLAISVQDNELQNTVGRIINAQGAVVLSVLLHNNTQQVDISKLPNGNYVLQTIKGSSQFIILK